MAKFIKYLKNHQLLAYFVLTYLISWVIWIPIQQMVLRWYGFLMPLVSVIITWFFNHPKTSILIAILFHPAMNTTGVYISGTLGAIFLIIILLVVVIIADKMWKRLPSDSPAIYQGNPGAA